MNIWIKESDENGISEETIISSLKKSLENRTIQNVLLVPPDYTRMNSKAGFITNQYYHILKERGCHVEIMPALGSHMPMTEAEYREMFGTDIPLETFVVHNCKKDCKLLGCIESSFVEKVTAGQFSIEIPIELNRIFFEKQYDLIISIGQVVPHEELGFSNYSKNFFIGCGGYHTISETHLMGAIYGMERIMATEKNPLRHILDLAYERYLTEFPILFVMTVTTAINENVHVHGIFIGEKRDSFEAAVEMSKKVNVYTLEKPIHKAIAYMEPKEFKTSWLANKALYRLRMAMEEGGELIVLAPGMYQFGETKENDALIRKYGYCGKEALIKLYQENQDLQENIPVAFHLIHGSVENRFTYTLAVKELSKVDIETVGYHYANYDDVIKKYHINVDTMKTGWIITQEGEEVYFVEKPALGLWVYGNHAQI